MTVHNERSYEKDWWVSGRKINGDKSLNKVWSDRRLCTGTQILCFIRRLFASVSIMKTRSNLPYILTLDNSIPFDQHLGNIHQIAQSSEDHHSTPTHRFAWNSLRSLFNLFNMSTPGGANISADQLKARYIGTGQWLCVSVWWWSPCYTGQCYYHSASSHSLFVLFHSRSRGHFKVVSYCETLNKQNLVRHSSLSRIPFIVQWVCKQHASRHPCVSCGALWPTFFLCSSSKWVHWKSESPNDRKDGATVRTVSVSVLWKSFLHFHLVG